MPDIFTHTHMKQTNILLYGIKRKLRELFNKNPAKIYNITVGNVIMSNGVVFFLVCFFFWRKGKEYENARTK